MSKLTECKQTEIGEIPKDWNIAYLGDSKLADLIMGQSPPSATYNKVGEGLPFLQGNAEFGDKYPKPALYCSEPIKIVERGDILISVRAPVGDINIADTRLCIGRGLAAIRPKANILHNNFLYYHLRFNKSRFEMLSAGSTFKAIRRNEFDLYNISLPSFPEQLKIAEILSTVDKAIEKVDEAIKKTERLKKGLMQELLTKGIGHKEFKDIEIGRVPKDWQVMHLDQVITEIGNGFASGKRDDNGIVQIRMNNVTTGGKLIFDKYIKVPKPDNVDFWTLRKGDFLFNNTNSYDLVGKSTVFEDTVFPCTFSNHFTRIKFDKNKTNPYFILYHFIILWQKGYFKSVAIRHVGQSAVHSRWLQRLTIPLPQKNEQDQIVEIIDSNENRIMKMYEKKQIFERIKKGLMNDLLTGNKRVKV